MKELWTRLKRRLRYPRTIRLHGPDGVLKFKVFNPVEEHRIIDSGGEEEVLERFLSEVGDEDCVFDIGASVGLMTIHAAAKATRGTVIAFEPDPETRSRLESNVAMNGFGNVRIIPWALGDQDGESILFSDGSAGLAPTLREQPDRIGAPKGEVAIQMRTLDRAVEQKMLPLPTILKIDIEGAEILCLKGARRLLAGDIGSRPRMILIELHPLFLPDFGSSVGEVETILLDAGYSVAWNSERGDQIHSCYKPVERSA